MPSLSNLRITPTLALLKLLAPVLVFCRFLGYLCNKEDCWDLGAKESALISEGTEGTTC